MNDKVIFAAIGVVATTLVSGLSYRWGKNNANTDTLKKSEAILKDAEEILALSKKELESKEDSK